MTNKQIMALIKRYGSPLYLFDAPKFRENIAAFRRAFKKRYPDVAIGYSYKTNYTPYICKVAAQERCLAEVVSTLEYELARRLGIECSEIVLNGPIKEEDVVEELLLGSGLVNLENPRDVRMVCGIARRNPNKQLKVGFRVNGSLNGRAKSRFGIDPEPDSLRELTGQLRRLGNVKVVGIHIHLPFRDAESYRERLALVCRIIEYLFEDCPEYVDVGGGYYGRIQPRFRRQLKVTRVPSFNEYARIVSAPLNDLVRRRKWSRHPQLILEPGTALVADTMTFLSSVIDTKVVGDTGIATLDSSFHNIRPNSRATQTPFQHIRNGQRGKSTSRGRWILGGYTCIESDVMASVESTAIDVGDLFQFFNIGSYSITMKPPFIKPNVPVIATAAGRKPVVIKRGESFDDVFRSFQF